MGHILGARRVVAAAACALALAACGGGGDDDSGATTATTATTAGGGAASSGSTVGGTADIVLTVEQLGAALPTDGDLPEGYTVGGRCLAPGDAGCVTDTDPYVSVSLQRGADGAYLSVVATPYPDAGAAVAQLDRERTTAADKDGAFDIPVDQLDDGTYIPGERGEGTLGDASVDGWSGFRLSTTFDEVHPDGEAAATQQETLVLQAGNAILRVEARAPAGPPSAPEVDALADQVVGHLA